MTVLKFVSLFKIFISCLGGGGGQHTLIAHQNKMPLILWKSQKQFLTSPSKSIRGQGLISVIMRIMNHFSAKLISAHWYHPCHCCCCSSSLPSTSEEQIFLNLCYLKKRGGQSWNTRSHLADMSVKLLWPTRINCNSFGEQLQLPGC